MSIFSSRFLDGNFFGSGMIPAVLIVILGVGFGLIEGVAWKALGGSCCLIGGAWVGYAREKKRQWGNG